MGVGVCFRSSEGLGWTNLSFFIIILFFGGCGSLFSDSEVRKEDRRGEWVGRDLWIRSHLTQLGHRRPRPSTRRRKQLSTSSYSLCAYVCTPLRGQGGFVCLFFFSVFSVRKENGCFPPPSSLSLILTSSPIHSQAPISPGAADEIFPFFPLYKCWWEMTHSFSHSLTHTRAYTHTHTLTHAWWQMGSDVTGPSRVLGSQSYELLLTADATESFQEIETLESCLLLSCWSQHMPEKGRVLITQAVFFFFFLRG